MNKRFSVYYLVAAYCGYTACRLIKDIQEGSPTSTAMNVITVGFFAVAAIAIAIYTTILVRREKKETQEKEGEKNLIDEKTQDAALQDEENDGSQG